MKRFLLYSILLIAGGANVLAQQGSLTANVNVDKYPTVSFVWHEQNPNTIPATDFTLVEGTEARRLP